MKVVVVLTKNYYCVQQNKLMPVPHTHCCPSVIYTPIMYFVYSVCYSDVYCCLTLQRYVNLFFPSEYVFSLHLGCLKNTGVEISDGVWTMGLERIKLCSIKGRLHFI